MSDFPLPPQSQNKSKITTISKGLVSPQAIDLEEVILGALMIDKKSTDEVMEILSVEVFYKEVHQDIFKAIKTLYENKIGIDLLTVSTELKRVNKLALIGGDFYLISLTQKVSSSAHIEFHSRIILQKYILRELIRTSSFTIEKAYHNDPDVFDMIDSVQKNIDKIYEVAIKEGVSINKNKLHDEKKELMEKVRNNEKGIISGILAGLKEFDIWSGGFQATDLITLAARPSMGKTTVAISIAVFNVFLKRIPVAFFSLEMSSIDIKNKVTSGALNIPYSNIRQGKLNHTQLSKIFQHYDLIDKSDLNIIDTSEHKNYYHNIENKIKELVKEGTKFFIIDYVQLIKLAKSSGNDTSDINRITRDLKALASELKVTILILAQLNRNVDNRPDKTPMLSDLKQSGSIEEDSDIVIFLLRDAYYQTLGKADLELPMKELGKTKFIVAKGRHVGVKTFIAFVDMLKSKMSSFFDD